MLRHLAEPRGYIDIAGVAQWITRLPTEQKISSSNPDALEQVVKCCPD